MEQAQGTMGTLVKANPNFSLEAERDYRRVGDTPLMEKFLSDLDKAKAPETV